MKTLSFKNGKATSKRVERIIYDGVYINNMELKGDFSILKKRIGTYFGYKLSTEGFNKAKNEIKTGIYNFFDRKFNTEMDKSDSLVVKFEISKKNYARTSEQLELNLRLDYKFLSKGEKIDSGADRFNLNIPMSIKYVTEVD